MAGAPASPDLSDELLIQMHGDGMSMAAIARAVNISRERVRQRLQRNGVSGPNYNRLPARAELQLAAAEVFSLDELAQRLRVSPAKLHVAIDRADMRDDILSALRANRDGRSIDRRSETKRRYIQILRDLAVRVGHTPTQEELEGEGLYHASLAEVFGSAIAAMEAAGLTPNERGEPPRSLPSSLQEEFEATADENVLQERARIIRVKGELIRPPTGNAHPAKVANSTQAYRRDPAVVAWIRQVANGRCEACGVEGYETDNGDRFLEVHHVVPLQDGGPDTIANAVAVCETCHGKLHRWVKRVELANDIRRRIRRLQASASK